MREQGRALRYIVQTFIRMMRQVKAAEKNGPTLREALANAFPNAVNTLYSFVGSSVVMTFDEYVKAMEEMLRKNNEEANVSLMK